MTDTKAFELGVNIATTPGKVVYQNDLMQLIQYEPTTEKVREASAADHPALDQQVLHPRPARKELVRALVRASQGLTVFVISWVNPDERTPSKTSTTTCATARWRRSTPSRRRPARSEVNALGYCLGGTLLAASLAYMAAKKDNRVVSATFMTRWSISAERRA